MEVTGLASCSGSPLPQLNLPAADVSRDSGRIVEATRAQSADSSGLSDRTCRHPFGQEDIGHPVTRHAPCDLRSSAPPPQKVSNRFRPLDRAADVLRDPQTISFRPVEREIYRRAERNELGIGGHGAARRQRNVQ